MKGKSAAYLQHFCFLFILFFLSSNAFGTTYTWAGGTGSKAWTTASNWSPSTAYPGQFGTTDSVIFNTSGTVTLTLVPSMTIAAFNVSAGTVNLTATVGRTINITTKLSIDSLATLVVNTSGINISVALTNNGTSACDWVNNGTFTTLGAFTVTSNAFTSNYTGSGTATLGSTSFSKDLSQASLTIGFPVSVPSPRSVTFSNASGGAPANGNAFTISKNFTFGVQCTFNENTIGRFTSGTVTGGDLKLFMNVNSIKNPPEVYFTNTGGVSLAKIDYQGTPGIIDFGFSSSTITLSSTINMIFSASKAVAGTALLNISGSSNTFTASSANLDLVSPFIGTNSYTSKVSLGGSNNTMNIGGYLNLNVDYGANPYGIGVASIGGSNNTLTIQSYIYTSAGPTDSLVFFGTGGVLNIGGDLTNDGTFIAGSGAVVLNGSSAQTISGSSNSFYNLTINNSAVVKNILASPVSVSNILTLSNGKIVSTNTNLLTLTSTATINGSPAPSNSSFVYGPMAKVISSNSSLAFTFPVGKDSSGLSSEYLPIGISSFSGAGTNVTFTAELKRRHVDFTSSPYLSYTNDSWIDHVDTSEYWTLTRSAASLNSKVTLSWNSNFSVVTNPATLRIVTDNGSSWNDLDAVSESPSYSGSNGAGTITSHNPSSYYSAFTLASLDNQNPFVPLTSPSVSCSGTNVSCYGGSNGTASVNASSGTMPYSYLWSNGASTSATTGLVAGTYYATVTDFYGYSASCSYVVTQPAALNASCSGTNVSCNGGNNGSVTVTASGGIGTPNTWTQRANFGGTSRQNAVGFSIGTKGYMGTGNDGNSIRKDFWEWNPVANTWAQKADFGGTARFFAVGFSIGTKGYIGTGFDDNGIEKDFWEWDQASNIWTQKADFGGTARNRAVGFSIGTKGYIGTGEDSSFQFTKDFWEWNQASNTWTQKADFGGTERLDAVGFSIGTKGYIGTGNTTGGYAKDFWEWNQASNTWSQKADFGGSARYGAVGFSIGAKGYIGTGDSLGIGGDKDNKDLWEWNQASNTWTQKADLGGAARYYACGFSIGTKGYTGLGLASTAFNDFWQYSPDGYTYLWSNGSTSSVISNLTAATYSATITDANGCTVSCSYTLTQPTALSAICGGTNVSCNGGSNGSASVTASGGTPAYSYLWNSGATISTINNRTAGTYKVTLTDARSCTATCSYTVTQPATITATSSSGTIACNGGTTTITVSAAGGTTPYSGTGIFVRTAGTYSFTVTDSNGCTAASNSVTITQPSALTVSASSGTIACNGASTTVTVTASGGTAPYTGTGNFTKNAGTYSFIVTDNNGCTATASITLTQPVALAATCSGTNVTTCYGGNNGSVSVTASGGTITVGTPNSWVNKGDFNDMSRQGAFSFSIGTKGYMGTGYNGTTHNDFWEYDPSNGVSGTWTQKMDFPGSARSNAVGFSIGTKGYAGTGGYGSYYNDFYRYNPSTNKWDTIAYFPGAARGGAVAFSIGAKGYIGTGENAASNIFYNDLWEYDPNTGDSGTWTMKKASFAGHGRAFASGFAIGSAGYIGLGESTATRWTDFWKYVPATDVMDSINYFPGTAREQASGFSIANRGYIAVGYDGSFLDDLWEYNPSTNSWSKRADFTGNPRYAASALSISGKGYIGFGRDGGGWPNDLREYTPTIYRYLWSNGDTRSSFSGLTAGTYSVTVSDNCGNAVSCGYTVTQPSVLNVSCNGTPVTCNGRSDGAASVTTSGGTTPYAYLWNNGATTSTISNKSAGTYSVTVTDAHSCTNSCSITLTQPPPFGASCGGANVACHGGSNGSVYVTPSGGTSPYNYSWSNGATTSSVFNLVAGSYSVLVIDNCGDGAACSYTATEPSALNASCNGTNVSCSGGTNGSASVTASGGTTISGTPNTWVQKADFGGTSRQYAAAFSIGTKGYIGTGDDGGLRKDFWEWNQPSNTWTQKADFGGTARVVAAGFSIGTKGYIGTGGDANGVTQDFWEYDPGLNTWTQKANFGGTARSGAVGFSINGKGYIGTGDDGSMTKDFWEYNPGNDSWTQKADLGGSTRAGAVGFSIGSKGYIGTGDDHFGSGKKQDFWEYNPVNDSWTQKANVGGTIRSFATGFSIGTKGYIGTGINSGAPYKDFWEYDQSSDAWTQKADFGGAARLGAVGFSIGSKGYLGTGSNTRDFWEYIPSTVSAYLYSWSNGATTSSLTGKTAGTYSVTITDANGCVASCSYTITQPSTLSVTCSGTNVSCNNGSNGSASVTASGGTTPYFYLWSNASTSSAISNLSPQSYSVTVTDSKGCSSSCSYTVTQPAASLSALCSGTHVVCFGQSSGSASVAASGGTTPYSYRWSSGSLTSSIFNRKSGTYRVTVTDYHGCTSSCTFTISQPSAPLNVSCSGNGVSCTGGNDGFVSILASGGTMPYAYAWSNGNTTSSLSNLAAGLYSATVTDANGCAASCSYVITAVSVVASSNGPVNLGNTLIFSAIIIGGKSPYLFSWSGPNGFTSTSQVDSIPNVACADSGNYAVTVTDGAGCIVSSVIQIGINNCVAKVSRVSGLWSDSTTWVDSVRVHPGDSVGVGNNVTVDVPSSVGKLGINTGSTLSINSGITLEVKDTLFINGSVLGQGVLNLNGQTQQAITQTTSGNTPEFGRLAIDNASHVVLKSTDIVVRDSLAFSNGKIITGSSIVTIDSLATVTGADTEKYIAGTEKLVFPSSGQVTRTLDIGDDSNYAPVTYKISNVQSSGTWTGSTSPDTAGVLYNAAFDANTVINRIWTLKNNGVDFGPINSNDSIFFNWTTDDTVGSAVEASKIVLAKFDSATGWIYYPPTQNGSGETNFVGFATSTNSLYGFGQLPDYSPALRLNRTGGDITADKAWTTCGCQIYPSDELEIAYTGTTPVTINNNFEIARVQIDPGGVMQVNAGQTLSINGPLTINSGSGSTGILQGDGTVVVKGDLTINGTLPASGTMVLSGDNPQNVSGINLVFNHLIINNADNITLLNNISVKGNLTINGKLQGTGVVKFNGTTLQTISGGPTTFKKVVIHNDSSVYLSTNMTVNDSLTFISGKIVTGLPDTVIIGPSGKVAGANSSNYIQGTERLTFPKGTALKIDTLQIGDASGYAPVTYTIKADSSGGTWTGSTNSYPWFRHPCSFIDSTKKVNRYWSLINSGIVTTSNNCPSNNVAFTWPPSDNDPGITGSTNLVMVKYESSDNSLTVFPPNTSTANTMILCGLASNSDFQIAAVCNCNPLSVKAYLEGYYNGSGAMNTPLHNQNPVLVTDVSATDSITVNLWEVTHLSNSSPDFSAKTILHSNGMATINLSTATYSSGLSDHAFYYIQIRQRNHLETWSATPVTFGSIGTIFYDFTTAASKAYGSNMKQMTGGFAFYCGDINSDNVCDVTDFNQMAGQVRAIASGYRKEDISGDGIVDVTDFNKLATNVRLVIQVKRP